MRLRPATRAIRYSFFVLLLISSFAHGQIGDTVISVVTWHYDNGRTGADTNEFLLNPTNVAAQTFGKLFTQSVDGLVVGQPLYLPGVTITGKGLHNVVYVATNHDSVYAFDADSNIGINSQPLWMTSILTYSGDGATSAPIDVTRGGAQTGFTEIGIVSTPVIDPAANAMYLVAETYESQRVVHRLHALDVRTGQEILGGPATIEATYTLNGVITTLQHTYQMNRPGLLLSNGHIYVGLGSTGLNSPPEQGWVLSYNAANLTQEGAFCDEPGSNFAAVWQHGAGLAADGNDHVYGDSGDGPYSSNTNLSDSLLEFTQVGTNITLSDYFTPWNQAFLNHEDADLSDGVLVVPDHAAPHPREVIAVGKGRTIYVLDRDNLGGFCTTCTDRDTQIVQEFDLPFLETGSPAYWNGRVYFTPTSSPIQAYSLSNGLLQLVAQSAPQTGFGHPFITSKGNSGGVLWSTNVNSIAAFDAMTLQLLYTTHQARNRRDELQGLAHFPMPIVANGKLFIGTTTSLAVFGLLPSLAVTQGNNQTAIVGTLLPVALKISVIDHYSGRGIAGVTVTFSDGGKGGSFSNPTGVTDNTGTVSTTYTLPTRSGSYSITASAVGFQPASFTETAVAGAPTGWFYEGGSGQTAPILTTLPQPLSEGVKDSFGNGVPGVVVTFDDGGAGGSFSNNPVTTDAHGLVSVRYTTGTRIGRVNITLSAASLHPQIFVETVTASTSGRMARPSALNMGAPF